MLEMDFCVLICATATTSATILCEAVVVFLFVKRIVHVCEFTALNANNIVVAKLVIPAVIQV